MYKMNVNRIRNIIVQLDKTPDSIYEYDTHVVCGYNFKNYHVLFNFTDEHVFITYIYEDSTYINDEIISIYDIKYMNIVISEHASRVEPS